MSFVFSSLSTPKDGGVKVEYVFTNVFVSLYSADSAAV